jgi:hypothetical protein
MKTKHLGVVCLGLWLLMAGRSAAAAEKDFVPLMDGTSFAGWKVTEENPGSWKIEDGAFVTRGPRAHLFYVGDEKPFVNFELVVEVLTEPGSNGGIYFHTRYQAKDWPHAGFESQVNVSHRDIIKTGSLYGLANIGLVHAPDGQWWTQRITVQGNKVTVKINEQPVVEYIEPPGAQPGPVFERKLGRGTFALQAHDPKSVVRYRNIRVKRLPD